MDYQKIVDELADFFNDGQSRPYRRKEVIASNFVNDDKIFRLEKGYVKVVSYSSRGDQQIFHIYGPGEIFPMTKLPFTPGKPLAFVNSLNFVAVCEVTVQERRLDDYNDLLIRKPQLLLQTVVQQNFIYDRLHNLSMESAQQKVAYRLLVLGDRFGIVHDDHTVISLPITIQEIADTINLSRETTGRVLNDLESRGFIMLSRKSILLYTAPLEKMLDYEHQPA